MQRSYPAGMIDKPMTPERLLAHSAIFEQVAQQEKDDRVAAELSRLADACVQIALTMIQHTPGRVRGTGLVR
jgi:hypothetical protein